MEENINLIRFVLNNEFYNVRFDEDLFQAGSIGLCNASTKYDATKGKFSSYATSAIRNEIIRELNKRNKNKTLSLDKELVDKFGVVTTFKDLLIGDNDINYVDCDKFYSKLKPQEKEVFNYLKSGVRQYEVAKLMGFSRQRVNQILREIKLKWGKYVGN